MVSLVFLVLQLLPLLNVGVGSIISMPNCIDHCGDVQIPYPFGIGANCYREPPYEIICNASFGSPKPFLREFNLEVLDINWPGRYSLRDPREPNSEDKGQMITVGMPRQNLCTSDGAKEIRSYDFKGSPYLYSMEDNVLMMEGCGGSALLKNRDRQVLAGCASVCDSDAPNKSGATCYGIGCCQASIIVRDEGYRSGVGVDYYEINVAFEQTIKSNICKASVALIDSSSMESFKGSLSNLQIFPTTLFWMGAVGQPEPFWEKNNLSLITPGLECQFGYEGNPNIPHGCQGI
ncbi:hypothetical protein RND81_12G165500 [Saponaria officinalis]|uniref:Wall-associated receptor kinase galacturonan-binding domain-containing protein n=1 Tax=Saponaria officinalis TaxID=3572 RepID=A0AAW1HBG6_SAPOF